MARCEDYPCCGHEQGDCPTADGRFRCLECGGLLAKNATESMHPRCKMRFLERMDTGRPGSDSEEYGDY